MVVAASLNAATLSSALLFIREGKIDKGIERQEQARDTCVTNLADLRQQIAASDSENVANSLKVVRNYRLRYPRHLGAAQRDDIPLSTREFQQAAQKILDEI
jgi:hypothetical protein